MHQLFTTQIYQKKIAFSLQDLKVEIQQIQNVDRAGQAWSKVNYINGYTSYASLDQLHRMSSTFAALEKKISKHVLTFSKALDFDLPKKALHMNSCWVNIMPYHALHTAHIHPHSVISGTFYVDIPAGASALKFEDPRLGLFMNTPQIKDKAQKQNLRFFSLQPKSGDVILFESWLKHEVPLNRSKKPRLSVSFNYGWN
jgi:uncharacterized protein (TIGR02466 family)